MRFVREILLAAVCGTLTACGGGGDGGGSVNSTPTPVPTPTPTISNLQNDQTFAASGAVTNVALSLPDGMVQSTGAKGEPISITYNAAGKSYTVQAAGGSQAFLQTDARSQRFAGETVYSKAATR